MWYQCNRDGRVRCCKACGDFMRSSPIYDAGQFCGRKPCAKKRLQSWQREFIRASTDDRFYIEKVLGEKVTGKQLGKLVEDRWNSLTEVDRTKFFGEAGDLAKALMTMLKC